MMTFMGYRVGDPTAPQFVKDAFDNLPRPTKDDMTIQPQPMTGTWAGFVNYGGTNV